jgi:hypothetical protein
MSGFSDFLAAELSSLTSLVRTPTGSLGYGTDLSCTTDITETLKEVDPHSTQAITESILRRLQTPNGSLALFEDSADYGLDLISLLNNGTTDRELRSLEQQITNEIRKDDRIAKVSVTTSFSYSTSTLEVKLTITPRSSNSFFSLTFAVTSSDILLKEVC